MYQNSPYIETKKGLKIQTLAINFIKVILVAGGGFEPPTFGL